MSPDKRLGRNLMKKTMSPLSNTIIPLRYRNHAYRSKEEEQCSLLPLSPSQFVRQFRDRFFVSPFLGLLHVPSVTDSMQRTV